MRLYPPAWRGRATSEQFEVADYVLPAGANIVSAGLRIVTHAGSLIPNVFSPDRWEEKSAAQPPRFAYFPFGGGPRVSVRALQCWKRHSSWRRLLSATSYVWFQTNESNRYRASPFAPRMVSVSRYKPANCVGDSLEACQGPRRWAGNDGQRICAAEKIDSRAHHFLWRWHDSHQT